MSFVQKIEHVKLSLSDMEKVFVTGPAQYARLGHESVLGD